MTVIDVRISRTKRTRRVLVMSKKRRRRRRWCRLSRQNWRMPVIVLCTGCMLLSIIFIWRNWWRRWRILVCRRVVSSVSPKSQRISELSHKWTSTRWSTNTGSSQSEKASTRTTGSATSRRNRYSWPCALIVTSRETYRRIRIRVKRTKVRRMGTSTSNQSRNPWT